MEKSRYVRVIEGEEVRRDDPIECFLPTRGVGSTFWVPEGAMAIEFPKMKRLRELPGVIGTLRKASNHFDPTQIGSGTAPPR